MESISKGKISRIKKRDGRVVDFNKDKVTDAIFKAAQAVGGNDRAMAEDLCNQVINILESKHDEDYIPEVEKIQDLVERVLIENGHAKTAKAFILYRQKRSEQRDAKKLAIEGIILSDEDCELSLNALKVLERRYLLRNPETGKIKETPMQLFRRVAHNIAQADANYGENVKETEEKFYKMMKKLEFLPNTPTLMNAGADLQQLSACFVIPVEDSMHGIFKALHDTAIIHKSGGGTGFSFSRLRPKKDRVSSTQGVSSGPIEFMKVFDYATNVIKQGGKRRGANMGIMRVDHPDILEFINMKADGKTLNNFNISVAATNKFMKALKNNEDYELINPRTKEVVEKVSARAVFDNVLTCAWSRGDPGLVFIDRMNETNPVKHVALIEATNPCGEQPLMPYESCNLGSININTCMIKGKFDWDKFRQLTHDCVHFLDNVIDMNNYPVQEIADMTRGTRKIGLGLMGFADVMFQLGIPYDSDEGVKFGEKIMKFMHEEAKKASIKLAERRGCFPFWEGSDYQKQGIKMRNSTVDTIAPTGTIGMIADASGGLEPNFAICYIKNVMDGTELIYTNRYFEKAAKERGFYSEELMRDIAQKGSVQTVEEVPKDVKRVFVTAMDIDPEWHVRMQGAFQKWCDSSISKTINFPKSATIKDVEKAYMLAWDLECKGITIYREGSMEQQVMNIATVNKKANADVDEAERKAVEMARKAAKKKSENCPECKAEMIFKEGCATCPSCSYSYCS